MMFLIVLVLFVIFVCFVDNCFLWVEFFVFDFLRVLGVSA